MRRALVSSLSTAVALGLLCFASDAFGQQPSPYRMEGIVFERDPETGIDKPVAGAAIRMLDVAVLDGPGRVRQVLSDERGRYSLEVPLGHNAPWIMQPPQGYVAKQKQYAYEPFITTIANPVYVKNYEVVRGAPLRILLRGYKRTSAMPKVMGSLGRQTAEGVDGGSAEIDADGAAIITVAKLSGEFSVGFTQSPGIPQITAPATIEFEDSFDAKRIIDSVSNDPNGALAIQDAAGRVATFSGCHPVIEAGKLTIALDALDASNSPSKPSSRRIKGRILDASGKPLHKVRLDIRIINAAGNKAEAMEVTTTDSQGQFSIAAPQGEGQKATLLLNFPGYVPRDVLNHTIPDTGANDASLGDFRIEKGNSIHVRVVGKDGSVLPGALLAPRDGMSTMALQKRTDEMGECKLTDMPTGLVRVDVAYGEISENCKIVVNSSQNEVLVLKAASLYPKSSIAPAAPSARKKPSLAVGQKAPDLVISEWTDGKSHKLADYRGKIVFLEFGGVWCSACQNAIPAIKELQQKYEKQGVVFLSIHTAGTDMSVVKSHLEHVDWKIATGIDAGDNIETGHTTGAYSIVGYPTKLIVDGEGKIAFTTDIERSDRDKIMTRMEELAKSLELPWPLDTGLDRDADLDAYNTKLKERLNKLLVAMLSEKLDAVLKKSVE